jgi:cytochrome c oxidase subunit 2
MFLLFIGWFLFLAWSIIRFRRSRQPRAVYTGVRGHVYSYAEVAVIACEAILLIGFAVPLWAKRVNQFPPAKEAVTLRVLGEQFAWNFHYPGPDGTQGRVDVKLVTKENPLGLDRSDPNAKDDIVTLNQMHLPVNKPAIIYVTSKDVIHSFKIPAMRVMQDAIPGTVVPMWFTPAKTGSYEIVCAQLCGLGHYRMRGFLTVESQEEFDKWIKQQAGRGGAATSYE